MNRHLTLLIAILGWAFITRPLSAATIVDFEDVNLAANDDLRATGTDASPLVSQGVHFNRSWNDTFACCPSGWAISNRTDLQTAGPGNAYSAVSNQGSGGGVDGSANFGVVNVIPGDGVRPRVSLANEHVLFPGSVRVDGMYVTNVTYAFLAIAEGRDDNTKDQPVFVKGAFGPGDWFRLDVTGLTSQLQETGTTSVYLADFRDGQQLIVDDWSWVDLTPLGDAVTSLEFAMSSSDLGDFGMNTPAYFAIDNLSYTVVPEPATGWALGVLALIAATWRPRQ